MLAMLEEIEDLVNGILLDRILNSDKQAMDAVHRIFEILEELKEQSEVAESGG